jgi:hypothetical protein
MLQSTVLKSDILKSDNSLKWGVFAATDSLSYKKRPSNRTSGSSKRRVLFGPPVKFRWNRGPSERSRQSFQRNYIARRDAFSSGEGSSGSHECWAIKEKNVRNVGILVFESDNCPNWSSLLNLHCGLDIGQVLKATGLPGSGACPIWGLSTVQSNFD